MYIQRVSYNYGGWKKLWNIFEISILQMKEFDVNVLEVQKWERIPAKQTSETSPPTSLVNDGPGSRRETM